MSVPCGKHPTQKPLALLERIIAASSDEDDLILDPFSGSGTTGIAAVRLNRRYMGFEIETEFIELSKKRYHREATATKAALKDADGAPAALPSARCARP